MPREPDIYLREESGPRCGQVHPLAPGEHTIGRDPGAAVSLRGPDVSRFHAALEVSADAITISDLGSKNGVFRGGAALVGRTALRDGDQISVGGVALSVHHPGAQVAAALARGGEVTVTRALSVGPAGDSLRAPLAAAVFFTALALVLHLWR